MRAKAFLQNGKPIRRRRQAFNGADFGAFGLHRQHEAGARRLAVNLHSTGTANAVLATDMRACRADDMAQEIAE
jgi:hypothetical protein